MSRVVKIIAALAIAAGLTFAAVEVSGSGSADAVQAWGPPNGTCVFCA
ncbi:hypothetical protein [Actinoplanes sp. TFC3]|nr:hypothetical protein [Actinoplanes sp. TFC3]